MHNRCVDAELETNHERHDQLRDWVLSHVVRAPLLLRGVLGMYADPPLTTRPLPWVGVHPRGPLWALWDALSSEAQAPKY